MLAELAARTFVDTYAADNTPEDVAAYVAEAFGPEVQAREIADPGAAYLVAEVDGVPAGYALLRPDPPPGCVPAGAALYLARFYVARGWHGRGVAARLLDAVHREAAARGARRLWLLVWERNPRAIAFYLKHGFRVVGSAEFTLGTDVQSDHVMTREVAPGTAR